MKLWRNNQGSYTLEATIAVPVLLAVLMFLINIIHVAMVYISMDHAVSETVKLVAAYSYPLNRENPVPGGGTAPQPDGNTNPLSDGGTTPVKVAGNDMAGQLITILKNKGSSFLLDVAIKEIIKKKIADFYPLGNINDHSFILSQVQFINPAEKSQETKAKEVNGIKLNPEDIAIVAVYTVKLPVPFLPLREITLSNTAIERAWTDG